MKSTLITILSSDIKILMEKLMTLVNDADKEETTSICASIYKEIENTPVTELVAIRAYLKDKVSTILSEDIKDGEETLEDGMTTPENAGANAEGEIEKESEEITKAKDLITNIENGIDQIEDLDKIAKLIDIKINLEDKISKIESSETQNDPNAIKELSDEVNNNESTIYSILDSLQESLGVSTETDENSETMPENVEETSTDKEEEPSDKNMEDLSDLDLEQTESEDTIDNQNTEDVEPIKSSVDEKESLETIEDLSDKIPEEVKDVDIEERTDDQKSPEDPEDSKFVDSTFSEGFGEDEEEIVEIPKKEFDEAIEFLQKLAQSGDIPADTEVEVEETVQDLKDLSEEYTESDEVLEEPKSYFDDVPLENEESSEEKEVVKSEVNTDSEIETETELEVVDTEEDSEKPDIVR